MPYGITAEVRKLIGNPSTTQIADTDIDTAIDGADSFIKSKTKKNDWASTDDEYEAIETSANYLAAHYMLLSRNIPGALDKAKELKATAMEMLDNLHAPFVVVAMKYRTSPLKNSSGSTDSLILGKS